jgi:hypothetical protein
VRPLHLSLLALLVCGCGDSTSSTGTGPDLAGAGDTPDLAMPSGSTDMATPPRPDQPQVDSHTGLVLDHVQLVTVTFPDYRYQAYVEHFGDFVFGSSWWKTVASEYGISPGTHVKKVQLPDPAPSMPITGKDIDALLLKRIADGTLPSPSHTSQYLFMVYFPSTTVLTEQGGGLCINVGGYHTALNVTGKGQIAYAVIGDCNAQDDVTVTASHELIEAATDPYRFNDGYYLDPNMDDPWSLQSGDEVGDLCEDEPGVKEGSIALTRSWSNEAAAAGMNPCVPTNGEPYMNVTVDPPGVVPVAAGTDVMFTITGWSVAGNLPPWNIALLDAGSNSLIGGGGSDFSLTELKPRLSGKTVYDNGSVTLTLTIPDTAQPGQSGGFKVLSGPLKYSWPVAFVVQ